MNKRSLSIKSIILEHPKSCSAIRVSLFTVSLLFSIEPFSRICVLILPDESTIPVFFAFEEFTVIDTVIMGHTELWKVKQERDRLYALVEMTEEDGMRVATLEVEFAEMDGYTAESRAGEFLSGAGIDESLHFGPMSEVAPGWKLRVLLAQALFASPDILLLDEPTNNLDINAIRWLEGILRLQKSTIIIIST